MTPSGQEKKDALGVGSPLNGSGWVMFMNVPSDQTTLLTYEKCVKVKRLGISRVTLRQELFPFPRFHTRKIPSNL